jgi:hypothetical protein
MNNFEQLKNEVDAIRATIFDPIYEVINAAEEDATKYYTKGVKSSASKLKKKMQELRKTISHPAIKTEMTKIQESAKNLRQTLIDETTKTPA